MIRKSIWPVGISLLLFLSVAACNGDSPDPQSNFNFPDAGDEDAGDAGDTDDLDASDTGDTSEVDDADVDELPPTRTCPEEIDDSCAADILGCPGDLSTMVACVSYGEPEDPGYRLEAQFSNGAIVHYRTTNVDDEVRELRTAYEPEGERCYHMVGEEEGDEPDSWGVSDPQFGSYVIHFVDDDVIIECSGVEDDERCSADLLSNAFSLPLERPEGCEPFQPDDQCAFDSDCGDGEGCCQPTGSTIRQCMSLEFCVSQRDPVDCETNADCDAGETCLRCERDDDGGEPRRECIPDEIADDEENSLGCVSDDCAPGAQQCADDRTCCKSAGIYQCLPPFECAEAPDPNPVCDPTDSQACPSSSQECCFSDLTNEFRCLYEGGTCQTNVCFGDVDCSSDQECCGHDPDEGTAGSCVTSCEPPDYSCADHDDCFGEEYCCKLPGYDTGECVSNEMSCSYPACTSDDDCLDGWICCEEEPLTEGVCVEGDDECPPPAP